MAGLVQDIKLLGENLPWLRQLRRDGLAAFEKQGIPSAKTEAWKYTKPRDLNADDFEMNVSSEIGDDKFELPFEAYRIHFNNGIFDPSQTELPQGVQVLPLIEAVLLQGDVRGYLGRLVKMERHPFAALNTCYLNEGVFIRVEKNVSLKKPLVLINHTMSGTANLFSICAICWFWRMGHRPSLLRSGTTPEKSSPAILPTW